MSAGSRSLMDGLRALFSDRRTRTFVLSALAFFVLVSFLLSSGTNRIPAVTPKLSSAPSRSSGQGWSFRSNKGSKYTAAVVLGRLARDEAQVKWLDELEDINEKAVYIVDDKKAPLHLERNHGREALVYLTYIIDHYDSLMDVTFFWHEGKFAWHNNVLMRHNSALTINNIRREHVMNQGYFPSRCDWYPGCPRWVSFEPTRAEHMLHENRYADIYNRQTWGKIFPNVTEMPVYLAETCCSQFAASRDMVRSISLDHWKRLWEWIDKDPFDQYTGRVMEMVWQYLFLGEEIFCPSMQQCYCDGYGICLDDDRVLRKWDRHNQRLIELADEKKQSDRDTERAHPDWEGPKKEGVERWHDANEKQKPLEARIKRLQERLIATWAYGVPDKEHDAILSPY